MLATWSDSFGLSALLERDSELDLYNSAYAIILGRKSTKQISLEEIIFLKDAGFFEETNIEYETKTYSLFEDTFITQKLLRVMLTPDLSLYETNNDENCIFLRFHKSKIDVFENFLKTMQLDGCVWLTMKDIGFSKLDFNYLNSTGAVLNQFKNQEKKRRFDFSKLRQKNSKIYEELKFQQNWYFRLFRRKRFYTDEKLRKINDFKKFIRWKWMAYWLPLAINADISNIFDMNRYLVEKVSTKLKVQLDAVDVHEYLGIHVCQLIPDTLKKLFDHEINKSSIILVSYRKIEDRTYDQWYFDHEKPDLMYKIYEKVQNYPDYFKSKKWYLEYLMKAVKLNEEDFFRFLRENNLIKAAEEVEKDEIKERESLELGIEVQIKSNPPKWSEFKLKKILEYAEI